MKKVLVIDDELSVARLIRAALTVAGVPYSLEFCTDGGQGRVKATQAQYDLITLDLAMPLVDGIETLERIKQDPRSASAPVVVVTALTDPAIHYRARELGAAAVLTKPFQLWELVSLFRLLLAGAQAETGDDRRPGLGYHPGPGSG